MTTFIRTSKVFVVDQCNNRCLTFHPGNSQLICANRWLEYFTAAENRHVLPLFTSLLNVTFAYDPVGYGVPYNYKMFGDSRELLVEISVQILIICLDHVCSKNKEKTQEQEMDVRIAKNFHPLPYK